MLMFYVPIFFLNRDRYSPFYFLFVTRSCVANKRIRIPKMFFNLHNNILYLLILVHTEATFTESERPYRVLKVNQIWEKAQKVRKRFFFKLRFL